jgi:hypothetical protein
MMKIKLRKLCLVSIAAILLTGCAGHQDRQRPIAYLDEETGVTMSVLDEAIVFYHEEPRVAVHARDYLYMGPVEVNRSGKHAYYLWFGNWSTIDRASGMLSVGSDQEPVYMKVDGKPLELMDRMSAAEVGVHSEPYNLPVGSERSAYFRVSLDQIRGIASARSIAIQVGAAERDYKYRIWKGDVGVLASFSDYGPQTTVDNN